MCESLSERLSEFELRLSQFSAEDLSYFDSLKLNYIEAMLERAKTYLAHDAKHLVVKLLEKSQGLFQVLESNVQSKTHKSETEAVDVEENDQQRIDPVMQFSLLRRELQAERFTLPNSSEGGHKKNNQHIAHETDTELQSFGQYQEMFEKMALDRLLAKVMQQIPENAGPLNPERLVIRSFKALQDISPEYLSRLLSYYESLLILQTVNSALK